MYSLVFDPNIEDPCGDARQVSSFYWVYKAKVNKVDDSLSINITCYDYYFANRKVRAVFNIGLAGLCFDKINKEAKMEIKKIIEKIILNKKVEIWINSSFTRKFCIIMINNQSLNYSLLRNGLGRYCRHEPYELDWWTVCRYEKSMENARGEKLGIWGDKKIFTGQAGNVNDRCPKK